MVLGEARFLKVGANVIREIGGAGESNQAWLWRQNLIPPGLIPSRHSTRHLHFSGLKHISNLETLLSSFPFWSQTWLYLRLGIQNYRYFGKDRSCHSFAFAKHFWLNLGIRHFSMWSNRQSVWAGILFILSYAIIQDPTFYCSPLKQYH